MSTRLNKVAARFSKIGSTPDLKEENITEVIEGVIDLYREADPPDRQDGWSL